MKKPLYVRVADWLSERRQIVDRYKAETGAVYLDHAHKWVIDCGNGKFRDIDYSNPQELGLVVNHAYYLGCHDGSSWYRR